MERNSLCSPEQFTHLQEHLAYAYESTEFYKSSFDRAGVSPGDLKSFEDLARFPFVCKTDVMADQRASLPFGTMLGVKSEYLRRVYCSGGPLYLMLTGKDIETAEQVTGRELSVAGLRAGDILDIASAYHWVVGGTGLDGGARRVGATVVPGGPGMTAMRVQVMREVGVTAIQAFTPYAETLGQYLREQGIDPRRDLKVRLLIIGGELRTATAKERLSELWGGAMIREVYGTGEAGLVAVECCEGGDGMHISEDCILEIVDPATGEPVSPENGGEIVLTELYREAQPFIRYRTGDITEGVDFEPCQCGRSTPRLKRIVGRQSSMLRVRGLFVYPEYVKGIVASHPELGACQVIVERRGTRDVLTVRVECKSDSCPGELAERLKRELKDAIQLRCELELVGRGTLGADAPLYEDRRRF